MKKEASGLVSAGLEQPLRPRLRAIEEIHLRHHVQQHPAGEEVAHDVRVDPRCSARRARPAARSPHGRRRTPRGRRRPRRPASGPGASSGRPGAACTTRPSPSARPRPSFRARHARTSASVSAKQRWTVAMKSSRFVPKRRKRYGCETPARRAIASVDVPWRPVCANSSQAASRISSRLITAVLRVPTTIMRSKLALTHNLVKRRSAAPPRPGRGRRRRGRCGTAARAHGRRRRRRPGTAPGRGTR